MNKQDIEDLLRRFQNGESTPEEELQLNLWYHKEAGISEWDDVIDEHYISDLLKQRINTQIDLIQNKPSKRRFWYYAAASIIVAMLGISFFFFNNSSKEFTELHSYIKNDIEPGDKKAILTLADGSTISLTDALDGQLATQSNITITKTADGQLSYTVNESEKLKASEISYNTISTPRGGEHQVVLPDGTKVWLNSESSIKFPVSFNNLKERKVELFGEAYFEVVSIKEQPFRVLSELQTIEVLGTHFNVMAYPNEKNLETTLLEGKVLVKYGSKEVTILPGQQVQQSAGQFRVVKHPDIEASVAWKNAVFQFDDTEIDKVLRQIERWYDVDVKYATIKPNVNFTGVIPRTVKVSSFLKALEQTCGVRFEIEGRNITVIDNKN